MSVLKILNCPHPHYFNITSYIKDYPKKPTAVINYALLIQIRLYILRHSLKNLNLHFGKGGGGSGFYLEFFSNLMGQ
jgi:hypothetical protein